MPDSYTIWLDLRRCLTFTHICGSSPKFCHKVETTQLCKLEAQTCSMTIPPMYKVSSRFGKVGVDTDPAQIPDLNERLRDELEHRQHPILPHLTLLMLLHLNEHKSPQPLSKF